MSVPEVSMVVGAVPGDEQGSLARDKCARGPRGKLCLLGVPKEAMARRGPDRKMVPVFHARTYVLRCRRGCQRQKLGWGATVIRIGARLVRQSRTRGLGGLAACNAGRRASRACSG